MQAAALSTVVPIPRAVPPISMMAGPSPSADVAKCQTACSNCGLRELCVPRGMTGREIEQFDQLIYARKRIKRGEALYRPGDEFKYLYSVRSGSFKTTALADDGREQVTAFYMSGEMMGLDGIGNNRHDATVVALEDSEVCLILYSAMERAAAQFPALQRQFHKLMSRELVRDHGIMMLLGVMRAEERLASFLLAISRRFKARGYSPAEFNLRMSRGEMASYLGMKLETISRMLSRFQDEGLIAVQQRNFRILDFTGLQAVLKQHLTN